MVSNNLDELDSPNDLDYSSGSEYSGDCSEADWVPLDHSNAQYQPYLSIQVDDFVEQLETRNLDQQIELITDRMKELKDLKDQATDSGWIRALQDEWFLLSDIRQQKQEEKCKYLKQKIKVLTKISEKREVLTLILGKKVPKSKKSVKSDIDIQPKQVKIEANQVSNDKIIVVEPGWKSGVCRQCKGTLSNRQIKNKKNNCERASCISIVEECEICVEQIITQIIKNDQKECPVCLDYFTTNTNKWQQSCCGDFRHTVCENCSNRLQNKCCVLCQKSQIDKVYKTTKYDIGPENQSTGHFYGKLETTDKEIPQEIHNSIYLNIIRYQKCLSMQNKISGDKYMKKAKQLIDQCES